MKERIGNRESWEKEEREGGRAGNRKRGRDDSENQRAMRLSFIKDARDNDSKGDMMLKVRSE